MDSSPLDGVQASLRVNSQLIVHKKKNLQNFKSF
jgi:hypothetical protein